MTRNGTTAPHNDRVDWVDYSKGICIVMVVMMHSVLGVEAAVGQTGFMHYVVEFARPFRMPDFFMISGLFLARVIDRDWRTYLDRKVMHFAYFYVLWVTIQFGFKAPAFAAETGWPSVARLYLVSFVDPFGTLWFIYLLPIFFVTIKLTRRVPPLLMWSIAAALEMSHLNTGWMVPDEFAARFVYIYSGYLFANQVFALSRKARTMPLVTMGALLIWAIAEETLVHFGYADLPGVSLALGLVGAGAIMMTGTLLAQMRWLDVLRYFGQHSIVIYLSFFLPMAASRTILLKTGIIHDIGWLSLTVTLIGVIGSVLMWWACRNTRLNFLYERPDAFWIAPKKQAAGLQPAE